MAGKKSSKQSAGERQAQKNSERSAAGRASVAKGRRFEDDVAELYRLQGADVLQNVEVCHKKVDILATFSYPYRHRVIVECKDEGRAVAANQRVREFHSLLESARRLGHAETAEIITRKPWGDAAKGAALETGVRLLTYAEKIAGLIDFTRYLKELVTKFEDRDPARPTEPALGRYYVDLSAARFAKKGEERIKVIDAHVQSWLRGTGTQKHLAIFGEYGAGKSTFCQKLAHDLAASFLRDPNSGRIPILLNLREFIGKLDIEAYITSFLDRECKVLNPKIDLFRAMNDAGIFLLIFDGLDEMAVKVDADTLESNLVEIDKLAASQNSKVILTSRPEYFVSAREEQEAVSPALNPLAGRKAMYEPLKILPWDEKQVEKFLQRRVPLVEGASEPWEYYADRIKSIGSLSDLSQRPVLLDMIVKTLPVLIANKTRINRPNLYKTYLVGEIKRQRIHKKRTLLITEEDRLSLLQRLAVSVYNDEIPFINFSAATNLVEEKIKPPKSELEAHTRDFLTNSFLIRRGDDYHFSHKSIMEYLVAAQFNEDIKKNAPDAFGKFPLQSAIVSFLKEFEPDRETLFRWIDETKSGSMYGAKATLAGNAATVLCAMSKDAFAGRDLSDVKLLSADLALANLNTTRLKGALLRHVNLKAARFSREKLAEASLRSLDLLFLCVSSSGLSRVRVLKARYEIEKIMRERGARSAVIDWRNSISETGDGLNCLSVNIARQDLLDSVRDVISREFDEFALYSDEYDRLIDKFPEFNNLIRHFTNKNA